jgi:hypothetical protein
MSFRSLPKKWMYAFHTLRVHEQLAPLHRAAQLKFHIRTATTEWACMSIGGGKTDSGADPLALASPVHVSYVSFGAKMVHTGSCWRCQDTASLLSTCRKKSYVGRAAERTEHPHGKTPL